eukprot:1390086-Prymnesium_polylepis.3
MVTHRPPFGGYPPPSCMTAPVTPWDMRSTLCGALAHMASVFSWTSRILWSSCFSLAFSVR